MDLRVEIVELAKFWLGKFYIWGGDDPSGFDCSGFVVEVLQSVGLIQDGLDFAAHGLYQLYKNNPISGNPQPGDLAFWFNDSEIASHVEIMIDDLRSIGASGSGSPQYNLSEHIQKFRERSLLGKELFKPGDHPTPGGPGDNVLIWLVLRAIQQREAMYRNGYIKIRPISRRPGYRPIRRRYR